MTTTSHRTAVRFLASAASAAALLGTLIMGATSAHAAAAPGTLQVANGVGVEMLTNQVRLESLNPVDVRVQTPEVSIVPSPQNLPYRPSSSVKLTWLVCLKQTYGQNAQGDCYFSPTPDNTGMVTTPRVVDWVSNGGVWSAPDYDWSFAPRNWATVGQGRYLFPWINVTVLNGDRFVNSTEIKPAANSTGALIVNTLSVTTSIGALKPAIRVGSTTYSTGEQATIQVGTVPVNYDYFLRDSIRTQLEVPTNVWACPANHAMQPGNFWEVKNTIKNTAVTRGNLDQFITGMNGCRAITIPCPECFLINDRTTIPLAIKTISVPANDLLLANLLPNQESTIKLYAVQNANIQATDRVTGDVYNQRIFSVGRPTTTTIVAANRLPVVQPPAIVDLNNLGDAANNAQGDAALADAAAIDQAVALAVDEVVAPAAGDAANAGNAAAADASAGQAASAAPAATPSGLAAVAGLDLTTSPLTGDQGVAANGGTTLRLRVPVTQARGKVIPLKAFVSPRAKGTVKFVLVRTTGSGKVVVGKSKTASLVKGKAKARWVLSKGKPAGAYTVYASFTPRTGSPAKGVTASKAVVVN